jgi:hypothetical protein
VSEDSVVPAPTRATDDQVVCATCGSTGSGPQVIIEWSRGFERGRVVWTCPVCARAYVRSIEGKLDSAWW